MKKVIRSRGVLSLLTLALMAPLCSPVFAQPNDTPPAPNPLQQLELTPEQRQQMQAEHVRSKVHSIKRRLTEAGFTSEAIQDTVISYYEDEQEAGVKLADNYWQLMKSMEDKASTDEQLAKQLSDFRILVQNEKARHEEAQENLRVGLRLAERPRLDGLLMSMGLTGDEREVANKYSALGGLKNFVTDMDGMAGADIKIDKG